MNVKRDVKVEEKVHVRNTTGFLQNLYVKLFITNFLHSADSLCEKSNES